MGVWTRAIQVDSSSEFIKCATCFLKATIMAENKLIQCTFFSIMYTYLFPIAGDDVKCSDLHILRDFSLPPHTVCVGGCGCGCGGSGYARAR